MLSTDTRKRRRTLSFTILRALTVFTKERNNAHYRRWYNNCLASYQFVLRSFGLKMKRRSPLQLDFSLDLFGPIQAYMGKNVLLYSKQAQQIKPNLEDPKDVWNRITFSILSANTPFETSVKGLNYAITCFDAGIELQSEVLTKLGAMVPDKAHYVNALPRNGGIFQYLKQREGWHYYRIRLRDSIKGFGLTKASFAACLLYPTMADLACIDTWLQKVFLGRTGFKTLGENDYLSVENKIRELAHSYGIHTFLAQWLIWDYRRGEVTDHDIFPGAHKIAA